MKVYVHTVSDQAPPFKDRCFGISTDPDGTGYQKANDWINAHQEWRGGERYEYGRAEYDLNFVWNLTDEGFEKIRTHKRENSVFGTLYIGTIMIEFSCAGGGYDPDNDTIIDDLYVYGMEGPEYDYHIHGVPYKFFSEVFIDIPQRRSKERFQREFEQNVISFLNEQPELIKEAVKNTIVNEWN